jgi:hypothetical protein
VTSLVRWRKQSLVLNLFEDGLGVKLILIQVGIDENSDYLTPTVKHPGPIVAQVLENLMSFGVFFLILLNELKQNPPERSRIEVLAQGAATLDRSTSHGLKIWLVVKEFLV